MITQCARPRFASADILLGTRRNLITTRFLSELLFSYNHIGYFLCIKKTGFSVNVLADQNLRYFGTFICMNLSTLFSYITFRNKKLQD